MARANAVPVVVTMRVKCGCGHSQVETYEFDLPAAESDAKEEYVPGTCPECGAPIRIDLRREKVLSCFANSPSATCSQIRPGQNHHVHGEHGAGDPFPKGKTQVDVDAARTPRKAHPR
jgi:hypothetical protein